MYRFVLDEADGAVFKRFSRSLPIECWLLLVDEDSAPHDRTMVYGTVSIPPRSLVRHDEGVREEFVSKLTDRANDMLRRCFIDARVTPSDTFVDPGKEKPEQMDAVVRQFVATANRTLTEAGV